ncbi:MAG: hypothetical protein ACK6EB_01730, partial [Planctomyces sp.]
GSESDMVNRWWLRMLCVAQLRRCCLRGPCPALPCPALPGGRVTVDGPALGARVAGATPATYSSRSRR